MIWGALFAAMLYGVAIYIAAFDVSEQTFRFWVVVALACIVGLLEQAARRTQ